MVPVPPSTPADVSRVHAVEIPTEINDILHSYDQRLAEWRGKYTRSARRWRYLGLSMLILATLASTGSTVLVSSFDKNECDEAETNVIWQKWLSVVFTVFSATCTSLIGTLGPQHRELLDLRKASKASKIRANLAVFFGNAMHMEPKKRDAKIDALIDQYAKYVCFLGQQ